MATQCKFMMDSRSMAPEDFIQGRPKVHNAFCKKQQNNKYVQIQVAQAAKKAYRGSHFPTNGECHFAKNDYFEKCPMYEALTTE